MRGGRPAISVIGCEPEFWSLGEGGPAKPLAEDEVALTEPLARELGCGVGRRGSAADSDRGGDSGGQYAGRKERHVAEPAR